MVSIFFSWRHSLLVTSSCRPHGEDHLLILVRKCYFLRFQPTTGSESTRRPVFSCTPAVNVALSLISSNNLLRRQCRSGNSTSLWSKISCFLINRCALYMFFLANQFFHKKFLKKETIYRVFFSKHKETEIGMKYFNAGVLVIGNAFITSQKL